MKFNFAILSAAVSAASAIHLPVSFSEEASLQRQFVDSSKGWLTQYFFGENGEAIDTFADSNEVTENAWDVLKKDPKKFSKVCDTYCFCHTMLNKHYSSRLSWRSSHQPQLDTSKTRKTSLFLFQPTMRFLTTNTKVKMFTSMPISGKIQSPTSLANSMRSLTRSI